MVDETTFDQVLDCLCVYIYIYIVRGRVVVQKHSSTSWDG